MGDLLDPETLELTGPQVRVLEGVLHAGEQHPLYRITRTGSLVYLAGGVARLDRRLSWVGLDGVEETIAADPADWRFPTLSRMDRGSP